MSDPSRLGMHRRRRLFVTGLRRAKLPPQAKHAEFSCGTASAARDGEPKHLIPRRLRDAIAFDL